MGANIDRRITYKRASEDTTLSHYRTRSIKEEEEECQIAIFHFSWYLCKWCYYSDVIHSLDRNNK